MEEIERENKGSDDFPYLPKSAEGIAQKGIFGFDPETKELFLAEMRPKIGSTVR